MRLTLEISKLANKGLRLLTRQLWSSKTTAAQLAMAGDGIHSVSLDEAIEAMRRESEPERPDKRRP